MSKKKKKKSSKTIVLSFVEANQFDSLLLCEEKSKCFPFFLPILYFIYEEAILHLSCNLSSDYIRLLYSVPLYIGISLILYSLSALVKRRIISGFLFFLPTELLCLLFTIQYFTFNSYKTFMTPDTLLTGADNVIKDFSDRLLIILSDGLLYIIIYHIPLIVSILLFKSGYKQFHSGFRKCFFTSFIAIAFIFLSLLINTEFINSNAFTTEYNFDNLVRNYGLTAAITQEIQYRLWGNPYENQYSPVGTAAYDIVMQESTAATLSENSVSADNDSPSVSSNNSEIPIVYGYNISDIDFDELSALEDNQTIISIHSYVNSLYPSSQNKYTGLFEGKNLILITAEAFSKEAIDINLTPTLYRLANNGIVFTDYYQPSWGGSTSTGEYAILTGLVPTAGVDSILRIKDNNLDFTIGNQLMNRNYFSIAYHNGWYDYYSRNLTHTAFGYSDFIGMGNGMEQGVTNVWPASDLEMMEYTVPQYIDNEPFSVYYMTVSGHCLYNWGGNAMSSKNREAVEDLTCSPTVKAYLAANLELENALSYLVRELEDKGIADNTVIVISPDHYPYGLECSTAWQTDRDYLSELYGYTPINNAMRDHSELIIWSGCLESSGPIVVDTPVYSLDILPTLSNLFGIDYDSRLMIGRDVFSDYIPLVIWPDHSWLTDLGYYNNSSAVFVPSDPNVQISEEYINAVKSIVSDKITYSKNVLNYDYYSYIYPSYL